MMINQVQKIQTDDSWHCLLNTPFVIFEIIFSDKRVSRDSQNRTKSKY